MAYLLSNICTKNYWNQTAIVEIIVGGWVVSFFETQSVVTNKLLISSVDQNLLLTSCIVSTGRYSY